MSPGLVNPPFAATERLAQRVLGGGVVFFVGAGFSLDSEGNTAKRLIARLLARLLAMGIWLAREADTTSTPTEARSLLDGLGSVFGLAEAKRKLADEHQPARCMTADNVDLLAREYYNFNEWCRSALGVLSGEMLELGERQSAVGERIHGLENFLLASLGKDTVPLEPVDWGALRYFDRVADRGKALFLDTMGFANAQIMCGAPRAADIDMVAESYGGHLRSRHHVLARLAREGLLPCLVTTNYDLLLEGAYRLAGFTERESGAVEHDELPPTSVPSFSPIAGADQFLARGESYRTALLLKIHGCVENYRKARATSLRLDEPDRKAWARYLPAMVFTYREIQTWRADAWSRDLLRTLLRTYTLALCGYSGADPVMHSTFREVYEEMAQLRSGLSAARGESRDAPVFFFDVAGKREFHSFEILRAATEAAGLRASVKLVEHPNHVEFHTTRGAFPTIDDHFRWLFHSVLRDMQAQALNSRLRRLTPRLLGHPCPDADHRTLCESFNALRRAEREAVCAASPGEARRVFERVVGWTWHFLPGLLRELALAELVESRQGPGRSVRSVRRWPWYFPASDRPEWTAWAVVVELALRRMVAAWRGGAVSDLRADLEWIAAEDSPHAAISFARGAHERQPLALCIRLAGFERPGRSPRLKGAYRRVTTWELDEQDVPWRTQEAQQCPSASTLWNHALGRPCTGERTAFYLGASDDNG